MNAERRLPTLVIGDKYEYKKPIVQGGMSIGVAGVGLFEAVEKEGGLPFLGGVGAGFLSDYFRKEHKTIFEADSLVVRDKILKILENNPDAKPGINFLCVVDNFADLVRTAVKHGAKIIASGAGLPKKLPELVADHPDVRLVPVVASEQGVRVICSLWWKNYKCLPGAIVIEDPRHAGGHLGVTPRQDINDEQFRPEIAIPGSLNWLEHFLKSIHMTGANIPIIHAGGYWTREDIHRAYDLGASAVQMGSKFVCTEECDASPGFKKKYIEAKESDIVLIKSPVGIPGRAIRTEFSGKIEEGKINDSCPFGCVNNCTNEAGKGPYCIIKRLTQRNVENGVVFAGSSAWRSEKIVTVHDIFMELVG